MNAKKMERKAAMDEKKDGREQQRMGNEKTATALADIVRQGPTNKRYSTLFMIPHL